MRRRTRLVSDIADPIGPYSHATEFGGLLFCTGQLPLDSAGVVIGDSPADQTSQVLHNFEAVCRDAGTRLQNALHVRVFLTDLAFSAEVNDVYASFFAEDPPARTTIGVAQLPLGVSVEIDAIVAVATDV